MLFFKLLVKKILKNPFTHVINFSGLLTSLIIIALLGVYCLSELTTDSHQKNKDHVFLITSHYGKDVGCHMPAVFKDYIDANIPGVRASVRMAETWDTPVFQVNDNTPLDSQLLFADKDFFTLFSYTAIDGNLETALNDPLSLVLTEPEAKRFFGQERAVGRTIRLNNQHALTVKAVIQEPAYNTFMSIKAITTIEARKIIQPSPEEYTNWDWHNFKLFLFLEKNIDAQSMEQQLATSLIENKNFEGLSITLLPVDKIYFSGLTENFGTLLKTGNKTQTYILMLVAFLVLIIALVNYINITSAHLWDGVKRVGIQKIIGAGRLAIFKHIVLESVLFFIIAAALSLYIAVAVSPAVQHFAGITFSHKLLASPGFIATFLASAVFMGFIVSLWPAITFSISSPITNLHKNSADRKNYIFKNGMVVAQFAIAIILITFTMLVQKQVTFGTSDLGFARENIIGIKMTPQLHNKRDILEQQLAENAYVQSVSFTQFFPGKPLSCWGVDMQINDEKKNIEFNIFDADAEFADMLDLHLLQGRLFTKNPTDKNKVLVNEEFIKKYDIENPIGATFQQIWQDECEIIGVIKDFHYRPVNEQIEPLVIRNSGYASYCLVKAHAGDFAHLHNFMQQIKETTAELSPSFPVDINFMDSATAQMYASELKFRRLFSLFSGGAILICCFGVLAMSIFACQRRIKEIGIRKVNGAQAWEIILLLNRDFIKWVIIAFTVAIPASWFVMNQWLQNFAYKTEISWWLFVLSGSVALVIALLTVSFETIKAATANPINSLRYE